MNLSRERGSGRAEMEDSFKHTDTLFIMVVSLCNAHCIVLCCNLTYFEFDSFLLNIISVVD